jgi:predicted DNA-binding WGR domain protein
MLSLPFALILILVSVLMVLELPWLLLGLEIVEVSGNHIVIKHQVLGFGITKKFSLNRVNGVFVSRQDNSDVNYYFDAKELKFFFLSFKQGKVAVNYGKTILGGINTIRFGANLDEGEAKQIVKLIHEKFPQYIYKKSKNTG